VASTETMCYVSWADKKTERCFQLMKTVDRKYSLNEWVTGGRLSISRFTRLFHRKRAKRAFRPDFEHRVLSPSHLSVKLVVYDYAAINCAFLAPAMVCLSQKNIFAKHALAVPKGGD